jgi:hypothetical protein
MTGPRVGVTPAENPAGGDDRLYLASAIVRRVQEADGETPKSVGSLTEKMLDAPWRSAIAMPEDATVEPPTIGIEAKIFAQPFQGVSPVPQTVRIGEESVAAEASLRAYF